MDLEAAAVAVTAAADGNSDQEAGTEAAVVLIQSDYDNNDEDDLDIPSRDDGGLDIPSRDISNVKKEDPTDDAENMIGTVKEAQDNSAFSGGR